MRPPPLALILPVAWSLSAAAPAEAHQLIPGVGGFPAMMLHPVAATDHLLAIVALGLLSGRNASRFAPPLLALTLAVLGGYLAGAIGISPDFAELVPLALAAICGALGALACRLSPAVLIALATLTGLAIGSATRPDDPGTPALILTGIGCAFSAALLFTLFAALARSADRDWQRIALRVAASWITACAVLVLTLEASRAWR